MFTMMREMGLRRALVDELPYLVPSVVIAEGLYKFHSFTLECLAFLGTWYALSAVGARVKGWLRSAKPVRS